MFFNHLTVLLLFAFCRCQLGDVRPVQNSDMTVFNGFLGEIAGQCEDGRLKRRCREFVMYTEHMRTPVKPDQPVAP